MGIRYYDDALEEKIKNWVVDDRVIILGPSSVLDLFKRVAQKNEDKITLPLIALVRDSNVGISNTTKRPMSYDGVRLYADENQSVLLNAIPLKITYTLDVYSRYFEEADEYIRNFVFNLINYPTLEILIPYNNVNYKHKAYIKLDPNISDTAPSERQEIDQFYKMSLKLSIDDAYLFNTPIVRNWKVEEDGVKIEEK